MVDLPNIIVVGGGSAIFTLILRELLTYIRHAIFDRKSTNGGNGAIVKVDIARLEERVTTTEEEVKGLRRWRHDAEPTLARVEEQHLKSVKQKYPR